MKIWVDGVEWYPVLLPQPDDEPTEETHDVPDETVQRWRAAINTFIDVQREIAQLRPRRYSSGAEWDDPWKEKDGRGVMEPTRIADLLEALPDDSTFDQISRHNVADSYLLDLIWTLSHHRIPQQQIERIINAWHRAARPTEMRAEAPQPEPGPTYHWVVTYVDKDGNEYATCEPCKGSGWELCVTPLGSAPTGHRCEHCGGTGMVAKQSEARDDAR